MRKRMVAIVAFAFIAGALTPAGSARAQTCCVCTDCMTDPQVPRCFADIDDAQCADFCTAQECDERALLDRACFAPLCPEFPYGPADSQPAPALGTVGIALAGLAAGLAGMGRLLRRGTRPPGR